MKYRCSFLGKKKEKESFSLLIYPNESKIKIGRKIGKAIRKEKEKRCDERKKEIEREICSCFTVRVPFSVCVHARAH